MHVQSQSANQELEPSFSAEREKKRKQDTQEGGMVLTRFFSEITLTNERTNERTNDPTRLFLNHLTTTLCGNHD